MASFTCANLATTFMALMRLASLKEFFHLIAALYLALSMKQVTLVKMTKVNSVSQSPRMAATLVSSVGFSPTMVQQCGLPRANVNLALAQKLSVGAVPQSVTAPLKVATSLLKAAHHSKSVQATTDLVGRQLGVISTCVVHPLLPTKLAAANGGAPPATVASSSLLSTKNVFFSPLLRKTKKLSTNLVVMKQAATPLNLQTLVLPLLLLAPPKLVTANGMATLLLPQTMVCLLCVAKVNTLLVLGAMVSLRVLSLKMATCSTELGGMLPGIQTPVFARPATLVLLPSI
mmetsp:Transcript_14355/g.21472  ORF Transcript_14355/g.21472 Transcript_14355/m.21472 type:complete len:288 (+) Transcript_14355:121-984(+)